MCGGSNQRPTLEWMRLQTTSLMEQLGVPIMKKMEVSGEGCEGGRNPMMRTMGRQSSGSAVSMQTMMQGMHGTGATLGEGHPGVWMSLLTTPRRQTDSRACTSQTSREPSAAFRLEGEGPLSQTCSGNLCFSTSMLTLDMSLMTTMPSHQHTQSQLPSGMRQKSQSTTLH